MEQQNRKEMMEGDGVSGAVGGVKPDDHLHPNPPATTTLLPIQPSAVSMTSSSSVTSTMSEFDVEYARQRAEGGGAASKKRKRRMRYKRTKSNKHFQDVGVSTTDMAQALHEGALKVAEEDLPLSTAPVVMSCALSTSAAVASQSHVAPESKENLQQVDICAESLEQQPPPCVLSTTELEGKLDENDNAAEELSCAPPLPMSPLPLETADEAKGETPEEIVAAVAPTEAETCAPLTLAIVADVAPSTTEVCAPLAPENKENAQLIDISGESLAEEPQPPATCVLSTTEPGDQFDHDPSRNDAAEQVEALSYAPPVPTSPLPLLDTDLDAMPPGDEAKSENPPEDEGTDLDLIVRNARHYFPLTEDAPTRTPTCAHEESATILHQAVDSDSLAKSEEGLDTVDAPEVEKNPEPVEIPRKSFTTLESPPTCVSSTLKLGDQLIDVAQKPAHSVDFEQELAVDAVAALSKTETCAPLTLEIVEELVTATPSIEEPLTTEFLPSQDMSGLIVGNTENSTFQDSFVMEDEEFESFMEEPRSLALQLAEKYMTTPTPTTTPATEQVPSSECLVLEGTLDIQVDREPIDDCGPLTMEEIEILRPATPTAFPELVAKEQDFFAAEETERLARLERMESETPRKIKVEKSTEVAVAPTEDSTSQGETAELVYDSEWDQDPGCCAAFRRGRSKAKTGDFKPRTSSIKQRISSSVANLRLFKHREPSRNK